MENLRSRTWLAAFGLALALIWVAPNVINFGDKWWFSKTKLNFGLDIQGGLHLVMGVDVDGVVSESTTRLAMLLKSEFEREAIPVSEVKATNALAGELSVTALNAAEVAKAQKYITDRYASMLQVMSVNENVINLKYFEAYMMDYKSKVIQQAIETIRNRIDEFGVAEPSISQQGSNRILVQLPGMADSERAKTLINTAAKLDFMMVADEFGSVDLPKLITEAEAAGDYDLGKLKYSDYVTRLNTDLKGKIPEGTIVLFEKSENAVSLEAGKVPYLIKTETNLGGGDLDDAHMTFDQYQKPQVQLIFNSIGTAKFKDLTTKSVGKRMAVVLDKVVKTAPNIIQPIGDGRPVITLGGGRDVQTMTDEAKMISTTLRAGALPASLQQLEERTVGPTLGADAIQKAALASLLGALVILVFMLIRYKAMGIISDLAIIINITSVVALLTSLGATLTLPGIAGMALTVGFAVDANVLINERMREELAKGSSMTVAIKEGYSRAMSAILDANITTAATAVVLLYFGTGPVRGFAVTLLLGIVTTMFANVFVSKVMIDNLVHRFGVKKISI